MNPPPPGWPRMSAALYYEDPARMIDWLCDALGFRIQMKVEGENGRIEHSELVMDGALVMVSGADRTERFPYRRAPAQVGGANTMNLMFYVDDVEAHCARAREKGATIVHEPQTTDYGEDHWTDRGYECRDPGGHHWWFYQRLRNPRA